MKNIVAQPKDVALMAGAIILVVALTLVSVSFGSAGAIIVMLATVFSASIVLGLSGRFAALACLLVTASLAQGMLAAATSSGIALWLDDVCLVGVAIAVVAKLISDGRIDALLFGLALLGMIGLAIATSANSSAAFYQARQIAVPIILLYFGMIMNEQQMRGFAKFLYAALIVNFVYMVLEFFGSHPIDPWRASGFNEFSTSTNAEVSQRELPGNYYYYYGTEGGQVFTRSGGLQFNPPGAALFMSSIALFAKAYAKGPFKWFVYALSTAGTALTIGRAGGVILALAAVQIRVSKIVSRVGFVLLAVVGAAVLGEFFSDQGKSTSHTAGLVVGFLYGLTHPIGGGFGTIGNAADSTVEDAGESLLGMFFASSGWIAFAVLAWLVYRAMRAGFTVPGVALTAAIVTSLFTESTSGLAVAAPLWILAGMALQSGAGQGIRRTNTNGPGKRASVAGKPPMARL